MHRLSESIAPIQQAAVRPLKRIVKKGRKSGESRDKSWEDVLRENLESEGLICEVSGEPEEPQSPPRVAAPERGHGQASNASGAGEPAYEEMIAEIHKMAEKPEQLVDSHMGIMMEPVRSGKWVNAAG